MYFEQITLCVTTVADIIHSRSSQKAKLYTGFSDSIPIPYEPFRVKQFYAYTASTTTEIT